MVKKTLLIKLKEMRIGFKEMFNLNGLEEEIAIAMLGIGGIVALIMGYSEIATFCFGALVGYLSKGFKDAHKE